MVRTKGTMQMNLSSISLSVALIFALGATSAQAQTTGATTNRDDEPVQTFYLANAGQTPDCNEIVTAIRNILTPQSKIYLVPSERTIVIRSTSDQLAIAQKLIHDLDHPKKSYRLTYTLNEMDGSKRISTRHYSMIAVTGQRTAFKQGTKVPVATGSYMTNTSAAQTQMTYVDVGMSFTATLNEVANGAELRSNVEESSVAEQTPVAGTQDPAIRQTVLEGTSLLTPDKPLVLGSLDIPGSTHRMEVEVAMEAIK